MKSLAALLCAVFLMPIIAGASDEVPEISHEELTKAIEQKAVTLIDVNGSKSYRSGHIPGAIDLETADTDLASKLPKEKDALVVAYCGSETCGAYKRGAEAAQKLGYTNVKHYKPGIKGWKERKAPVEQESP